MKHYELYVKRAASSPWVLVFENDNVEDVYKAIEDGDWDDYDFCLKDGDEYLYGDEVI